MTGKSIENSPKGLGRCLSGKERLFGEHEGVKLNPQQPALCGCMCPVTSGGSERQVHAESSLTRQTAQPEW